MAKLCQSCSMPMDKDPGGGGTEATERRAISIVRYAIKMGSFSILISRQKKCKTSAFSK